MKFHHTLATRSVLGTALTTLVTLLLSAPVAAQSGLFLLDHDGNAGRLSELEAMFIQSRFDALELDDSGLLLPVLALMVTAEFETATETSPVVARVFNPEMFFRLWGSEDNWMDFGIGHESNGQSIGSEESFLREGDVFEAKGEPRWYIRDSLSRGLDYTSINWRRAWTDNLVTLLETRHFLNTGLAARARGGTHHHHTGTDYQLLRFAGTTVDPYRLQQRPGGLLQPQQQLGAGH